MLNRYVFLLVVVMTTSLNSKALEKDLLQAGVIFLKGDQLESQPYALHGLWEFYPNELISSLEMNAKTTQSFIEVPYWWVEVNGRPSVQTATYRLKVKLSEFDRQSTLALSMPEVYCSYDLWVNGKKLGQNGVVAKTKSDAKPQWKPETYTFKTESDSLEIILHLSNFYHHRTGISKSILLGYADQLTNRKDRIESANTILLVGVGFLILSAGLCFMRLRNISLIFYALLCLSWMLRSVFSNHYQMVQWFPDINWYVCVRIEYISLYLSTLFGSLLVSSLFPRDANKYFRLFFIITGVCFTIFTIVAPPVIFTTYVQLYISLSCILLLSILVIIIKAYMESREGAGLILITALLAVGIFGYVILAYLGLFELNEFVFNIGFLIQFIFILTTVIRRIYKMETTQDYDMMTFDHATRTKL